jgi:hypothetical protein
MKDPGRGYAKTFLAQLEECLGLAHDRGVRIVANAGGLNPAGLAAATRALADKLGIGVTVAHVEGDDLLARADELGFGSPLTANAYLGAWGIVDCLNSGADIVITGRVTDASVVVGPAAAHFGWARGDYHRLAGAVVAGHVIECGAQATGGNYSFFTAIADLDDADVKDALALLAEHGERPDEKFLRMLGRVILYTNSIDTKLLTGKSLPTGTNRPLVAALLEDKRLAAAVFERIVPHLQKRVLVDRYHMDPAFMLAQMEKGEISLPPGAEGFFAIPHWSKVAPTYQAAVEKVLDLLDKAYGGRFTNYRKGELGPQFLRETSKKARAMEALQQTQNADILLSSPHFPGHQFFALNRS